MFALVRGGLLVRLVVGYGRRLSYPRQRIISAPCQIIPKLGAEACIIGKSNMDHCKIDLFAH